MAIFNILYGNYYPPHGEFKLICIGKFARRTWVNFTQQYGKNRQRCQQNIFYYAVWQLLLYFYREFPSKIFYVYWIPRYQNYTQIQVLTKRLLDKNLYLYIPHIEKPLYNSGRNKHTWQEDWTYRHRRSFALKFT